MDRRRSTLGENLFTRVVVLRWVLPVSGSLDVPGLLPMPPVAATPTGSCDVRAASN